MIAVAVIGVVRIVAVVAVGGAQALNGRGSAVRGRLVVVARAVICRVVVVACAVICRMVVVACVIVVGGVGQPGDHQHGCQDRRHRQAAARQDRRPAGHPRCSGDDGNDRQNRCRCVGQLGSLGDLEPADPGDARESGHEPAEGGEGVDGEQRGADPAGGAEQCCDCDGGLRDRQHDEQSGQRGVLGVDAGRCRVHHCGAR